MTADRKNGHRGARVMRQVSFAAAAALAIAAAIPGGVATAGDKPPADLAFSGAATAIGTQSTVNSNPEPSQVPDLADLQTAESTSTWDSSGSADAVGSLANGGGVSEIPGLICLAASSSDFCGQLNAGFDSATVGVLGNFPIGIDGKGVVHAPMYNPFAAHATYPSPQDATAPVVGTNHVPTTSNQLASQFPAQIPLTMGTDRAAFTIGKAIAHAAQDGVSSSATGQGTQFPDIFQKGQTSTSTTQFIQNGSFVTRATAAVHDIEIGAVAGLAVQSVVATADVTMTPGKRAVDSSSVVAKGVTLGGTPASIDNKGVHVAGQSDDHVRGMLLTLGIADVRLVGVKKADTAAGHGVSAQGLLVRFDTSVGGIPVPQLPANVISGCESVEQPTVGAIVSKLPVGADPCTGVGANPNAEYYGQVLFAQAGVQNLAFKDSGQSTDTLINVIGDGGPTINDITPPDQPAPTADNFVPAGAGTRSVQSPITSGLGLGQVPATTTTTTTSGNPNAVPTGESALPASAMQLLSQDGSLQGAAKRTLWLFPIFMLAGIGLLAGRFLRTPPRWALG